MQKSELEEALVGIEPTGHYWFDLGQFMGEKSIKFVMVNPHHVHKTKELDDNSPSKNDRKDPRVIAGLVRDCIMLMCIWNFSFWLVLFIF